MLASYAEHVVVGVGDIVPKPPAMPWVEAGALSASAQTALTALDELGIGAGDAVLIHGAAGGVGTFAVQLARVRGATAIGTASEPNHESLRSLSAVPLAYGDGLAARVRGFAPDGVDAALDLSGQIEALRASLELVGDKRRIDTTTFQPAAAELGIRRLSTDRSTAHLRELTGLYAAGELQVVIRRAYPLSAAAEAHRQMETGHGQGKIALVVMPFTDGEIAYITSQRLGRLATVQPTGTLQNSPVGVHYNAKLDTIDVGGHSMAASQKFRNVRDNGRVALVVDDIASVQPWRVRCLEIRGHAEALTDPTDSASGFAGAIIRVHPRWIISWGIDPDHLSLGKRNVEGSPGVVWADNTSPA
jgi:PPOX class F420-dependent enzyme/OxyR family protein